MPDDYIDISVPIAPDMLTWSSHEGAGVETSESIHAGGSVRVTKLRLSTHTGTHVDAPDHFLADGETVDKLSLDALIGRARVYDFTGISEITADRLSAAGVGAVPRALLKTDNSAWIRKGPMPDLPAHITTDAAQYLVDNAIALLGTDGLTVDGPNSAGAHLALLGAEVIIVETLDLSHVAPGDYHFICLPLRIAGVDGAPARAVLRRGGRERV